MAADMSDEMTLVCNIIHDLCDSALVATITGVLLGSWFIQRIHIAHEAERAMIMWLIGQVEQYAENAFTYWNSILYKERISEVLKAKLRSEFNYLVRSTDNLRCIDDDEKRIHDLTYAMMNMYKAATGGGFDTASVSEDEAKEHIRRCASTSANLRCLLLSYMAGRPTLWKRVTAMLGCGSCAPK